MNTTRRIKIKILNPVIVTLVLALSAMISATLAQAQCTTVLSGLLTPLGSVLSDQGNLIISETGTPDLNSGRISIVDPRGNRRTLIDGLPSAIDDVGGPSGPSGIVMGGRNLYVLIGAGDVGIPGPRMGSTLENPNGPSSPIFSSVLLMHFGAATEKHTSGFTLSAEDQATLANGGTVTLSNGPRDKITIRKVVDFENFIPFPLPDVPDNIQLSNPYGLVALDGLLYVTDGGRNLVWQVDPSTGAYSQLASFPDIPNPLFPTLGGPTLQAVPTGITARYHQLFVTLFRGFPFPSGTSTVEQIDPVTGSDTQFIGGLTAAIDIFALKSAAAQNYYILQYASADVLGGAGMVLQFTDPAGPPTVLADCVTAPTSMTLDKPTDTLFVTQNDGSLIAIPFQR
ncbi:MAG: ScyD/ScyE family protein [Verrucomicrobiota bacterium]